MITEPPIVTSSARAIRSITSRYYLLWWVYSFAGGFLFGVYPLFLRSRGLTQLQSNSVLAAYFFMTFLTDVPTGAFADALGRRTSLMLACLLRSVGFGLYFFSHRFWLFVVAESADAVGTTFANGAIDAWAVDALDRAGFIGLKDRIFSRGSQLTNAGWLVSAIIGAYVADYSLAVPWLLGAAGYLLCLGVGMKLMAGEPRVRHAGLSRLAAAVGGRARAGVREGFHNRAVMLLTLASAIQFGSWAPFWMIWPQYFTAHLGVGVWALGWLFCLFSAGRLVGAELIARLQPGAASRAALLAGLASGAGLLLLLAGFAGGHLGLMLGLLCLMNLCNGAMQPVVQSWINEHLAAENRATLLSFQSTFATLGGAIGLLACGYLADQWGLLAGWQLAGAIGVCGGVFYWRLRNGVEEARRGGELSGSGQASGG